MGLLRLAEICHDKETSIAFLQQQGILPQQKLCSNGHGMILVVSSDQNKNKHDRWRCKLRTCREDCSIRKGNWLETSRLEYRTIVLFLYCWSYEMTTITFCERELHMTSHTVVDWNNSLREVCAASLLNNPTCIGGPNMTVEVDESMFSQRKNNAGRLVPTQWVFGGYCRETKECFLYAIPDRSADTLIAVIKQFILPGTTIISDCWRSYNEISSHNQYTHLKVNQSLNFVDPDTEAHTQHIESTWRDAKMANKRHFGTHRIMLDSYLCEFMWRKRLRNRCSFESIMSDITNYWKPN